MFFADPLRLVELLTKVWISLWVRRQLHIVQDYSVQPKESRSTF